MWTNDFDYVICATKEDIEGIIRGMYGDVCKEVIDEYIWHAMLPEQHFKYHEEQYVAGNYHTVRIHRDRPTQWYIDNYGEGYFACSEF